MHTHTYIYIYIGRFYNLLYVVGKWSKAELTAGRSIFNYTSPLAIGSPALEPPFLAIAIADGGLDDHLSSFLNGTQKR